MGGSNFVTLGVIPDAFNDLVLTAGINQSGLGTVVPGITGKKIYVHGLFLSAPGSVSYAWLDLTGAGATVAAPMGTLGVGPAGAAHVWPFSQYPLFSLAIGDGLGLSASGPIGGRVTYCQG